MSTQTETIESLSNRRQFFRAEDEAFVHVSKMQTDQNAASCFEVSPAFGLLSEFQLIDVESKQLLRSITDRDKNLGQYLKLLNRKLDALSRVTAFSNQPLDHNEIQKINLSEGGIGICEAADFEAGDKVAIKLVLLPSYCGLMLEGNVISASQNVDSDYELHIEFANISDPHRQLIARHIMRLQSALKHSDDPAEL